MTRDEILALPPGEQLDRLVAETFEKQPADVDPDYLEAHNILMHKHLWTVDMDHREWQPMPVSTRPVYALRLWDAIVAKAFVEIYRDGYHARAEIGFGDYIAWDTTWMLALCHAWLLWCEAHP